MNRRDGGKDIAQLIVHNTGRKGVRDADFAAGCGFTVKQMYQRLGQKLLMIARSSWFELQPEKRSGTQGDARPVIVFTLSGVIMISAWLGTERALQFAMTIVPLLKTRRRSSKNRKRRPPRQHEPSRQASYSKVFAKLQQELQRLLGR